MAGKRETRLIVLEDSSVRVFDVELRRGEKPLIVCNDMVFPGENAGKSFRFKGNDKEALLRVISNLKDDLSNQGLLSVSECEIRMPLDC